MMLEGKVALITGGARGIGAAIGSAFVKAGAKVLLTDVLAELGQATAKSLGENAAFIAHDVRLDDQWESAVSQAIERFGALDLVVNNAGIEITRLIADAEAEEFHRLFDVNVLGVLLGMKHGFRAMRPDGPAGRGGAIVNLASVAALTCSPGLAEYSATKSAVERLTKVGAVEAGRLGYGVRVNCIYPSLIPTDMGAGLGAKFVGLGLFPDDAAVDEFIEGHTPLGRWGTVDDVARAAVFLCSEYADFITGAGIPVDGAFAIA